MLLSAARKGSFYEGGIRIPFMLQWPGHIRGGRTIDEPVISLDLLPTVLEAASVERAPVKSMDGISLLPMLTTGSGTDLQRDFYWRYGRSGALRAGPWKIVRQVAGRGPEPRWQLFNLDTDIGETRDVSAAEPERAANMVARWNKLNSQMAPPGLLSGVDPYPRE